MTREEAIEAVKAKMDYYESDKRLRAAMETLVPELRESEDERIRKWLFNLFDSRNSNFVEELDNYNGNVTREEILACLEKQKDASKAIEAVERIDKYIDEHLANAHDMKDSNPDKKYYRGWDDALGKMSGILQDVYSDEKQKERKSLNIIAASEWLRKHVCNYMNSEYNEFHKCVEYDGSIDKERLINDFEEAMQKEQKPIHPNIEREYIEKRLRGLIDKEGEYYRGAREELAHLFYILGGQPSQYLINNIATEEQTPKSVEAEALKIKKNIWHVCTKDVFIDGKPVYLKGDIVNSDDFMLVLDTPTAKAAFHRVWFPNNDEEKFCNAVLHRNPDKQ